jgi:hypothetical protein
VPVESSGTDNVIYRLVQDMAVCLSRVPSGTRHVIREVLADEA